MKKRRNIAAAIVLSSMMAVSTCAMAVPVLTASADYTITIDKPEGSNDTATHTYEAYQVFKGDLSGTGADAVLSNITWGSGVKGTDLLTALKATTAFGDTNPFTSCNSAADVADVIDKWSNDSANVQKFADIVSANLDAVTISGTSGGTSLTATAPGYYFIKDKDNTLDNAELGAYTDYILKVVDNVTITAKENVPTIAKKILESDGLKEANTASIGDVITFQLDSKVPDMSAYNKYYYVINDTMCEGLTFDNTSVKVYIDNMTNPIDSTYYEVQTGSAAGGYTFQIVMKDFKTKYVDKTGKDIKVTYSATLNDNADRTTFGNENKVNLTYSNNPNHDYVGENEPSDTPSDGDVTGKTPDSNTKTYTTSIKINKIDGAKSGDNQGKPLSGAKFRLKGVKVNKVIIANQNNFVEAADGIYYQLNNGTFTLTAPTTDTGSDYKDTTKKYKLNTNSTMHSVDSTDNVYYVDGTTDSKGMISFAGLGAGTYTLTEIEAPEGYNKLANPITIEISATPTLNGPSWTVLKDSSALTNPTGIYEFTVENNKGATLPSTGGIGTTLFYIIGGTLVAGSIVLLITKKRMHSTEE